ncbi:MAG: DUF3179 domain-containing protein [Chloroflexota bacterium]
MQLFKTSKITWILAIVATATILLVVSCTVPTPTPSEPAASDDTGTAASESMSETSSDEASSDEASSSEGSTMEIEYLPEETPPFGRGGWTTDFSKRIVEWNTIMSGGPPKDGIPSIDDPAFEEIAAASQRLSGRDPVIVYENNGEARAYPLSILIWHEIVNDEVGGKPVSVTFCPLCNASIVFDREFDGQILDFGTTGKLRNSDLIMYDRQTETWWQQFTGEGVVGEYAGHQLTFLASQVLSFADFAEEYPDGTVLAIPTEFRRDYGRNPYAGYDGGTPFLFRGTIDDRLEAIVRVVGLEQGGEAMAYAFEDVAAAGVVNDAFAGTDIVIFHKEGTASALDTASISQGKDVGSVGVFDRNVDGQVLTFETNGDGTFTDNETGTTWNILGEAISGELEGTQLEQVISFDHFWFAWQAFYPDTGLHEG